ncbi:MAG TPA: PQQ-binding-like beta-propeller repeat protein [Solirubrobacterales bacterium]|nr:PQQ-binding-like beta-propeller repeat protein [Solirubrobacterales bacterium]
MANLFATIWNQYRAPTIAGAFSIVAVVGVGGALLLSSGGGSEETTAATTTTTTAAPTGPPLTPWPTYGFDNARTRYLPTKTVRPPYKVAWSYDARHLMEYSPIVADGVVYGIDNNGEAFALRAASGKQIWRRDVATLNASAPTYSDGRLYISNLEPGQVQALKAQNGKVAWRRSLPGRTESSPLVVGNTVIAGCECGSVYAFNKRTGKQLWSTAVGGAVKASPAYDKGTVFVGDYGGQMTALRASNGSVRWTASAGGSIYGTAAVAFGRVYAGTLTGGMNAFNESTGSQSWSTSTGGYVYSAAAAAKAPGTPPSIYFGSYSGTVYAVNAQTGSIRWTQSAHGPVSGAGSVVGDVFYVGDLKTTQTFGFRASDGKLVFASSDGAYNPVISDGRLLYMTGYRLIYALKPGKGRSENGFVVRGKRKARVAA